MQDVSLYLITDRFQTAGRELPAVVADALAAGVTAVQLREKDLPDDEYTLLARTLKILTHRYDARLFINSRLKVALDVGADGVHLGAASIPVAEARRLCGNSLLIGYSAHTLREARLAEQDGADFITFGPVYQTPSKAVYGQPVGIKALEEACKSMSIPVFALGGITPGVIGDVTAVGCRRAALISAICAAENPGRSAATILNLLQVAAPAPRN